MASVANAILVNESLSASKTSAPYTLQAGSGKFIAHLKMSDKVGAVTLTGKLTHSADNITWHDLHVFTGFAANGAEIGQITTNVLPNIRAELALAGGGTANIFCALWFDPRA